MLLKYQDDIARIEGRGPRILNEVQAELRALPGWAMPAARQSTMTSRRRTARKLAQHRLHFARTLRKAGMRVGPASVKDAIEAVLAAGIGSRDDFYWTLHAVLVSRHEDHAIFDEAFRLFWKSRELIEKLLAMFSPVAPDPREAEASCCREPRQPAMFEGPRRTSRAKKSPRSRSTPLHHRQRGVAG